MKILQINISDRRGGANKIGVDLYKELHRRRHDSSLFVGKKVTKDAGVFQLDKPNPLITFVSRITGRDLTNAITRRLSYLFANDIDLFGSDAFMKTEEFRRADVIHCHNLHTNYFKLSVLEKIAHIKPLIWTFHDMWPITAHCAHAFDGALKKNGFFKCPSLDIYPPMAWHNERYLERKKKAIYQKSNFHIVTPSQWLKEKVKQSVLKDKSIQVIYNGVDIKIFKPYHKEETRTELGLPHHKKIVLSVAKRGQSNVWKGGNFLSKTENKLQKDTKNILFVTVGGDAHERTEQKLTVPYIKDQSELAKYYSAADMLIYPSIADNCPLVVLEAHSCGLPVVAFETGGIPELVDHERTGYIARYKDADDLLQGVKFILGSTEMYYRHLRSNAIQKIKNNFTLDMMTDNYIELYNNVINSYAKTTN